MQDHPRKAAIILIIVLTLAASAFSQNSDVAGTINRYLTIRTEMGNFSGAILAAKDGRIIIRKGYGYADVEKRTPYTPETKHEVASISKMFTAMTALKLRDENKLKLGDPICKYIETCPVQWQPITIQELMRHTSGIPDYEAKLGLGSEKYLEFMTKPGANRQIVEDAKKLPLDFTPGEKFNYSNTGYIILSRIIEEAAGEPFEKYVAKAILRPAKMSNSGVINFKDPPKDLATGYSFGDIGWDKVLSGVSLLDGHLKRMPQLTLESPEGDAWLYTTIDDLYKWSLIMDGSPLVSSQEAKEVFTPGLENYGYGWFIGKGFGRTRMRHNGGLPGYISDFVKFPDDKITIIIFSNIDRARLSNIVRDISSIILGLPYDMPVRGTVEKLTDEEVSRLVGEYKTADGKTLTVSKEPEYITAKLQDRYTAGLIPLSPIEFYFPLGDGKAIFTIGDNGRAIRVNMRYSGEDHIAERVK